MNTHAKPVFITASFLMGWLLLPTTGQTEISSVQITPAQPTYQDSVVFSVEGWLPDLCWSVEGFDFSQMSPNAFAADIYAVDVWEPGQVCLPVIVGYQYFTTFGPLDPGTYTIFVTEFHQSLWDPLPNDAFLTFEVTRDVVEIAGCVEYFSSQLPLPDITLHLDPGDPTVSDGFGCYLFPTVPVGVSYTVTPDACNDVIDCDDAISFFDASLAAQGAIGLITLDPLQECAADVSCNDDVSFFDASLIAQYAIGIISEWPPECGCQTWCFDPDNRSYDPLTEDQIDQDYTGICKGDVSGNWSPATVSSAPAEDQRLSDEFSSSGSLTAKNLANIDAYSVQMEIHFDPSAYRFEGIALQDRLDDWHLYYREESGVVHVGAFGVTPIAASADIVHLRFQPVDAASGSDQIRITEYLINESFRVASTLERDVASLPAEFTLEQNYPNPFNPTTTITYSLQEESRVRLTVYNTLGEEIVVLVSDEQTAGHHHVVFDAVGLSTGIYFYELHAQRSRLIRKMVLIK